ncbi:MAG TPA: class I SAM-dependent methyltransferase, partial [Rhizomicrobium sp.]|nr:class I SAM-dependent methyltransferase [Rhizomicrobium sp.]
DAQAILDRMFQSFEERLVTAVRDRAATRVLDVGCGTGGTTLAIARQTGAACLGVDISRPMIAVAKARAEAERANAQFLTADAQSHAFEPGSFDMAVSRFGVMFFDDPVTAFANLCRGVRGALCVFVWRGAAENPFMTTAECAAAPFLPDMPARKPDAPGQFGFADPARVDRILTDSGWGGIQIKPVDIPCSILKSELHAYVTRLGPLGMVLQEADAGTRARVIEAVRAAFAPFVQGEEVRFTAACWEIRAHAS